MHGKLLKAPDLERPQQKTQRDRKHNATYFLQRRRTSSSTQPGEVCFRFTYAQHTHAGRVLSRLHLEPSHCIHSHTVTFVFTSPHLCQGCSFLRLPTCLQNCVSLSLHLEASRHLIEYWRVHRLLSRQVPVSVKKTLLSCKPLPCGPTA